MQYAMEHKRRWTTDEVNLRLHVLPYIGFLRLDRIRKTHIIALQQDLRGKGYSPGTCNRIMSMVRFIFNQAIRWDVLAPGSNPVAGIQAYEDNGARERFLTEAEVIRLFAELEKNKNIQVGQVIKLLLYTGARKREILDARWEHIDFQRRILLVPLSKSGKPRKITLSDVAVSLLQSLPREEGIPWVFFNPKTRKPPVSIFSAWDTIRRNVGLRDVRLHDLRHSFASFLVNSGRSLYEVQKLLGHHDPKVTMRYAHLATKSLVEAVNVVGRLLPGQRKAS
ncbi:MAG: site-specific integrase [Bilophila sp.]